MDALSVRRLRRSDCGRVSGGPRRDPRSVACTVEKAVLGAGQAHFDQPGAKLPSRPVKANRKVAFGYTEGPGEIRPRLVLQVNPSQQVCLCERKKANNLVQTAAHCGIDFAVGLQRDFCVLAPRISGEFVASSPRRPPVVVGNGGREQPAEPAPDAPHVAQVVRPHDRAQCKVLHHVPRFVDISQSADQEPQKAPLALDQGSFNCDASGTGRPPWAQIPPGLASGKPGAHRRTPRIRFVSPRTR
jgi:hypothetical protein